MEFWNMQGVYLEPFDVGRKGSQKIELSDESFQNIKKAFDNQ